MFISLVILVTDLAGCFGQTEDGTFTRLNGYMLSDAYNSLTLSQTRNTAIRCAIRCMQKPGTCVSFNYNAQTGECQPNAQSPYNNPLGVREVPFWSLYYRETDGAWQLVFRTQSNNNLSPYDAWMGTLTLPSTVEDGCRLMTTSFPCTTIYRHSLVDMWDSLGVKSVLLEMYKSGERVVSIQFDGTGTTYTSWFQQANIVDSGWSTFSKFRSFNIFALEWSDCARTFYINQEFGGCPVDLGWMMVVDVRTTHVPCGCGFDSQSDTPAFLYSPGEDVVRFEDGVYNWNKWRTETLASRVYNLY